MDLLSLLVEKASELVEREEEREYEIVLVADSSTFDSATESLSLLRGPFGLDIETYPRSEFVGDKQAGLQPYKSLIRLIQIFDGDKTVYVFDLLKLGIGSIRTAPFWEKPMIGHNAMFELKHLLHAGIPVKQVGCTLLADRAINGNRRNLRKEEGLSTKASLQSIAKELLGRDISKEEQTSDWSCEQLTAEQIEYAALDAYLPPKIFDIQRKQLAEKKQGDTYTLMRNAQITVAKMELAGLGFDVEEHEKRVLLWEEERDKILTDIYGRVGKELNFNSTKQVSEWLDEILTDQEVEEWEYTKTGLLSSSTDVFKRKQNINEIFPRVIDYRHVSKKISSFGKGIYKFVSVSDNRIYGSFGLGTTASGRMSSSKPNMQNMPRDGFRDLFIARPGYVLISLDYSQQELRAAALLSKDTELLKIYRKGGDTHRETVSTLLGKPVEEVTKEERQLGKAVNFGLLFGQGPRGLAMYAKKSYGVSMSEEQGREHIGKYFKRYCELKQWQRRTAKLSECTGKAYTQGGKVRDFFREARGFKYTTSLNHPIQGSCGEVLLHALAMLEPVINDDCLLVNTIHDELLFEVREDIAEQQMDEIKEIMEKAFVEVFPNSQEFNKNLVEGSIGKNWQEAK